MPAKKKQAIGRTGPKASGQGTSRNAKAKERAEHHTSQLRFPVVGIGASAGGLKALKRFFAAMPVDSGMAFVVIPHLDPTHDSLMVELLSKQTAMKVCEIEEGMPVEANRVYFIPPNRNLSIIGGRLHLAELTERRRLQTPIDPFFRSLA